MKEIIDQIEMYRKEKRVLKAQLCKYCGINVNTYTNYLKGSKIPFLVVDRMLRYLDKQILIIDKI